MQRLLVTMFAMLLSGMAAAVAQVGPTNTSRAPASRVPTIPMRLPMAVPGMIPTVANGTPLGAIQLNLGNLAPIPGTTLGTITLCPTTGITSSAANTAIDASSAAGTSGLSSSSPPSSASLPITSPFGMSILSGTCSPTGTVTSASSSDSSAALGLPDPSTMTGSTLGDAMTPPDTTTVGGAGTSPLIVVPTPGTPVTPCGGTSTITGTSSLAMLNDGTGVAGTIGLSPPFGC
jgi:hypothetical protein